MFWCVEYFSGPPRCDQFLCYCALQKSCIIHSSFCDRAHGSSFVAFVLSATASAAFNPVQFLVHDLFRSKVCVCCRDIVCIWLCSMLVFREKEFSVKLAEFVFYETQNYNVLQYVLMVMGSVSSQYNYWCLHDCFLSWLIAETWQNVTYQCTVG